MICGTSGRGSRQHGPDEPPDLPHWIGPVEIDRLGALFAIRCPEDLAPLLREASGLWEPESRCWLLPGRAIVRLVPKLKRATAPGAGPGGIDPGADGKVRSL
jgi:hypothetical protein